MGCGLLAVEARDKLRRMRLRMLASFCALMLVGFALADSATDAAAGVMHRMFPSVASHFRFERMAGDLPAYDVNASRGEVVVRGTDGVAMCRGAYDYLREAVGAQATWGGTTLGKGGLRDLHLTDKSPYKFVLQDNVCTFGYTTAFYGWKEWQRYLDVMALHGVNMEFAPVGGEAIWQRVWLSFGVSQADLNNFFTGPAFLPWHRMGNVNKHDGPLPESYLRESVALEKKILGRMRELGIHPVAPAFAGFVPPGFNKVYRNEQVIHVGSWAGFQGDYRTWILSPLSPMYEKIGGAYVKEWEKEFGHADYFLADSFNELDVPVPADRQQRLETLARFGKSVYDGIRAGNPDGTWVMQGWLFYNDAQFWDKDSVKALLSDVPDDKMIILDLFAEGQPIWKLQDAFYGKQWILSTITTWGGNNQEYGNFETYRKLSADTLSAPDHGKLVGFGMSFEGSESNETEYEMLCDSAWSSQAIDLEQFISEECVRDRYGVRSDLAERAWRHFANSTYAMSPGMHPNHLLQRRPEPLSITSRGAVNDSDDFRQGVDLLVQARSTLSGSELYRDDVCELVAQWALLEADHQLREAVVAQSLGDNDYSKQCEKNFVHLSDEADRLLASHPLDRLQRWTGLARDWGKSDSDRDYYEVDAKRQVTVWGGPDLSEYAAKMWSGLIDGYYVSRWTRWLDALRSGKSTDTQAWEESWIMHPGGFSSHRFSDPMREAARMVNELKAVPPSRLEKELVGAAIGQWKPDEQNETYRERIWDVSDAVKKAGDVIVLFQYTSGGCRLDIDGVELLVDGQMVSTDTHFGRTGYEDVNNMFRLKIGDIKSGAKIELRAKVRSDGGSDSSGTVYLLNRGPGQLMGGTGFEPVTPSV